MRGQSDGTRVVNYRYAEKNLLAERYHYMYTPYEGPDFLRAYRLHRQELRDRLHAMRMARLGDATPEIAATEELRAAVLGERKTGPFPLNERPSEILPAQPGEVALETRKLLFDLLQLYFYRPEQTADVGSAWMEFLLKRFEVSKRLCVAYTVELKPASAEYDELENYALFAVLLTWVYQTRKNPRFLNGVLKLVDLLASLGESAGSALSQLALLIAVEGEMAAVDSLLMEHHISL